MAPSVLHLDATDALPRASRDFIPRCRQGYAAIPEAPALFPRASLPDREHVG